jgi:hypothetical protein
MIHSDVTQWLVTIYGGFPPKMEVYGIIALILVGMLMRFAMIFRQPHA